MVGKENLMKRKNANDPEKEIKVTLKDGTNLTLVKFGKIDKELKVSLEGVKAEFEVPRYVYFSKSNYGFDKVAGVLAKYCRTCSFWFAISKLSPDGTWADIYNKEDVHFDGIRFRSGCNSCYERLKVEKSEKDETKKLAPKADISVQSSKSSLKKVSVFMLPEHRKYLRKLAIDQGTTTGNVLAEIIAQDKERQKFDR